jgi:hypothetical protein
MTDVVALEPAVDPGNRITFLLDLELTLKCKYVNYEKYQKDYTQ